MCPGEHSPQDACPTNGNVERPPQPQSNGNRASQQANGGGFPGKGTHAEKEVQRAKTEIKNKIDHKKKKIRDMTNPPGGFDETPLPDAPPGYTVKFTFHAAWNLPIADLRTHSADPFVHATLTTDVPKRNREESSLTLRTRTVQKSTKPEWEQEWIVANVPSSGFTLDCRLYDEDVADHNDRLGYVTIRIPHIDERWPGFGPEGKVFLVRKRTGSKRAYLLKAAMSALSKNVTMTPELRVSIDVLGVSNPPHAQVYTVGPTRWVRHFSPMIGRLTGVKVNKDEERDADGSATHEDGKKSKKYKKYDFQANEIQLAGPVPPRLYHRYVEFRPMIGRMFLSHGLRGRILNKALHKQHNRIYNYDSTTEYGTFEPQSVEASLQFLKMVHFDEGGRIFTYVLTLDGLFRFTETGREFGIDLLSKHTMHSDVATYVACAGEFFIRHLAKPDRSDDPEHPELSKHRTPDRRSSRGSPPPRDPSHYQLIIDNDSGTYRPDKSILPDLQAFFKRNLPGLDVRTMHCADEELSALKQAQLNAKRRAGRPVTNMVLDRNRSSSSLSSSDEDRLADLERGGPAGVPFRSKKERAWEALEDPRRLKDWRRVVDGGDRGGGAGPSSNGRPG